MKKNKKGFTLVELMVVVLIIGILASMAVPYYNKTVETSRATDAMALGHLLGSAYRMYSVDNPGGSLSGTIDNNCNSGGCNSGDTSGCRLIRCSYVAPQDWTNASYSYKVGPGSCGGGVAACVRRVGGSAPYDSWGYNFTTLGACYPQGSGTPACPRF